MVNAHFGSILQGKTFYLYRFWENDKMEDSWQYVIPLEDILKSFQREKTEWMSEWERNKTQRRNGLGDCFVASVINTQSCTLNKFGFKANYRTYFTEYTSYILQTQFFSTLFFSFSLFWQ